MLFRSPHQAPPHRHEASAACLLSNPNGDRQRCQWPAPPPKLASSPVLPESGRSAIEDQGQSQGGRPEGRRIFQMNGIGSVADCPALVWQGRSEEHTSELQSLMRISYAVFCLKKKNTNRHTNR